MVKASVHIILFPKVLQWDCARLVTCASRCQRPFADGSLDWFPDIHKFSRFSFLVCSFLIKLRQFVGSPRHGIMGLPHIELAYILYALLFARLFHEVSMRFPCICAGTKAIKMSTLNVRRNCINFGFRVGLSISFTAGTSIQFTVLAPARLLEWQMQPCLGRRKGNFLQNANIIVASASAADR